MASPFSTFRKRQKAWLAVLGVMCMIAFVFGSTQCAGPGGAGGVPGNAVVASTKYGDLHESDIYQMLVTRRAVNEFLQRIVAQTQMASFGDRQFPPQFLQQMMGFHLQQLQLEGLVAPETEASVVDTMILARKAEELGMVVSEEAVGEFIEQRTQKKLTRDQLMEIIKQVGVSPQRLYDGIRTQLLAAKVSNMFARGLFATPPAQQWEYYLRMNQRARAEVVPLPVADFVAKVPEPSEEALRKFFEEHKETLHQPGTPEPGFKQPHKAALQYIRADYEKFLAQQEVTDAEIAAHYEKFKDTRYLYTEPTPDEEKAWREKHGQTEEKQTDDKANDKPADEKPDDGKSDSGTPEKETTDDAKKPDAGEAKKPETSGSNDGASEGNDQESSCDAAQDEPAAQSEADDAAKPVDAKPADAKAAETKAEGAQPGAEASATEPDAKTEPKAEEGKSLLELSSELALPRDIRDGPKPKHKPLWRVEDQIRRELAGQKAAKKMQEVLQAIKPALDKYYDTFALWKAEHPDMEGKRPTRPDITELAQQRGLTSHETGLLSTHRIATETNLGQALADSFQQPSQVEAAIEKSPLFRASMAQDSAGNQYLYWKIDDSPEHVPTFEEAKREVVETWKEIEARSLAEKKAQELAEQARKADGSLKETFSDQEGIKVAETGPFTWMTVGNPMLGPQQPRLTNVTGVEAAGSEFMRTVFGLDEGQVAVAFNEPKSIAYVVRLGSLEPSPTVLRETFAVETPRQSQNYMSLAQEQNFETSRSWIEEMREDAGLHWERPPVQAVAMQ